MKTIFVDEGSSFVKALEIGKFDENIAFPSRVIAGKINDMSSPTLISDRCYVVNGTTLSVCPTTDEPQTTRNGAEYQTSDTMLVLVHEALRKLGCGGHDVNLSVTLPIDLFFSGGVNHAMIQAKKDRLLSKVTHCNGQPLANIVNVTVRPEAFSVALDAMLDDDGNILPSYAHVKKVFVVDIGGTTTDMALMTNDGEIEKFKSSRNAVFPLRDRLEQLLIEKFPTITEVPISVMDDVLVHRRLGNHEVSGELEQAAREQASGIAKDMHAFAGNLSAIDLLVIAGGGAHTIGVHIMEHFPNVTSVIPPTPELSVIRGYNKYLMDA